jgi:DMSO/TMAO reductase YedYZ molybdopterin-dependent catalytic subunit
MDGRPTRGSSGPDILDRAGVKGGARQVVFRGADSGKLDASSEPIRFERSLSMDDAQGSQALLAHAMNGETLPIQGGYPLRVIVPGVVCRGLRQMAHRD